MSQSSDGFLFAALGSRQPLTARTVHIRRLYDLMQLCIHRNDLARATRAWSALARCKEVSWMSMWSTALFLLAAHVGEGNHNPKRLEYLRTMMLRHHADRRRIFREFIFHLIMAGCYEEAAEELQLYLPSFPYQNDFILHFYAGLTSLHLAQPITSPNPNLLQDACTHFEHAIAIDPTNIMAQTFLTKIASLNDKSLNLGETDQNSDEETGMGSVAEENHKRKRIRALT